MLGPQKILNLKNFGPEKNLGLKKFWIQKQCWVRKKFGAEKNFGSENFVVVVLVILVTWTPNHLNSAKSP